MKKLVYVVWGLLMLGLFISACSKNEGDGSPNLYQPFDLEGTIYYRDMGMVDEIRKYEMYEFQSSKDVQYVVRKGYALGEILEDPVPYTYSFDYPFLQLKKDGKVFVTAQFQNQDSLQIRGTNWFKRLETLD